VELADGAIDAGSEAEVVGVEDEAAGHGRAGSAYPPSRLYAPKSPHRKGIDPDLVHFSCAAAKGVYGWTVGFEASDGLAW
jgi:hypothetical protein